MQTVIVDISPEGEVAVAAEGVKGSGCQALTRAIEAALGTTVGDVKKPEFFQQAPAAQSAQAGAK